MQFTILTLFPDFFPGPLDFSLSGKSYNKLWTIDLINIRDFADNAHQKVDDKPCGGGSGMVMRPDVVGNAIDFALSKNQYDKLIYPSPRGQIFKQQNARQLVQMQNILFLCGRYEGIDQRIIEYYNFEEYSIGDYILSGGEIATTVIIDSILRHLPGNIKNNHVHQDESFHQILGMENILEYPQYTKPINWNGINVPEILLSGHHQNIAAYQLQQAIEYTKKNRPDLLSNSTKGSA
jgi:tRNA (guanine37-N1)-methyltransferase